MSAVAFASGGLGGLLIVTQSATHRAARITWIRNLLAKHVIGGLSVIRLIAGAGAPAFGEKLALAHA